VSSGPESVLTFVDLAPAAYARADEPLPPIRSGKFVQLFHGDDEHLVFSPKEQSVFHADIVSRYLQPMGVRGTWNSQRDAWHLSDPAWRILGGGHFKLNSNSRMLALFGVSLAYGPFDRTGMLERLQDPSRRLKKG
jgi:hypothetical protein